VLTIGTIKKLVEWLSGGYQQQEEAPSPLIKIKVFNKRLARQVGKMEMQEKIAKKKAIEARQKGDIPGSKLYMKNSLQYRKWAYATEKFKMQMEAVQMRLEQAKVMAKFTNVAEELVGKLHGIQQQGKMPEIAKMLSEIDLGFGNMEAILGETSST